MTDLRQALRDAVAAPPDDGIDLVAVVAHGRRARGRRRRLVVAAIATATATVVVAGVATVAVVTRDAGTEGPEPAPVVPPKRIEQLEDPVRPPRDFVKHPVRGFEPDAPLLREGDVVLGGADEVQEAYLTQDLQVLVSRRLQGQWGLIDPATPTEVDWLPVDPRWDEEVLPLCGFWKGDGRGECVQGERTLWFYVFRGPGPRRIQLLRFDRVTREWSEAGRAPRREPPPSSVEARLVDNARVVIDGPAGRHVVRLDRAPFCDPRDDLAPRYEADTGVGLVTVEGEFVTVEYYCSSLVDPGGGGDDGLVVLDAEGQVLVDLQTYDVGHALVHGRFFVHEGMLVDLVAGQVYRLLEKEPTGIGSGFVSAYAWVMSFRGGLLTWTETHVEKDFPTSGDVRRRIVHLTPLPGG